MEPRKFRFYKEEKKWYIDFPEWTGDKWELEMVCGADDMLDIIAGPGHREAFITMSDKSFIIKDTEIKSFELIKIKDTPDIGGAVYQFTEWYGRIYNKTVWLCHVTGFVFGEMPETIYIG